jgi:hypothetical protein
MKSRTIFIGRWQMADGRWELGRKAGIASAGKAKAEG